MMGMKLGRIGMGYDGIDLTDGIDAVPRHETSGLPHTFEGALHVPETVPFTQRIAVASAVRRQLLGHINNPDETLIPLTWDMDPTWDGYYQLVDGRIRLEEGISLVYGAWPFNASALRTPTVRPAFEVELTGDVVTNDHSLDDSVVYPWAALPASAQQVEWQDGDVVATRTSESGAIHFLTADYFDRALYYHIPPASFYDGACVFESVVTAPGCEVAEDSPLMATVGLDWEHQPARWRISNGLLRITPTFEDSDASLFAISAFDGTSWSTPKRFRLYGNDTYGNITSLEVVSIMVNSPELVVVRFGCVTTNNPRGGDLGRKQLTISLRRGSRFAHMVLDADLPVDKWGIRRETTEAASAVTGGIRATANDADGDRYVIATHKAATNDLTNGGRTLSVAAQKFTFGVGLEVGGSGAGTYDSAQHLVYQFHAGMNGRVRASGRLYGT